MRPLVFFHFAGSFYAVDNRANDYRRDASSTTDSDAVVETDNTNPKRSFRNVLSRFAERTSCVGPPYINSSNHFYSRAFWSFAFIVMIVATIVNVYFNIDTFRERAVKTTVTIGYSALNFPTVTVCNTNAVRRSALAMGSEDLKNFVSMHEPVKAERPPAQQGNQGQSSPNQGTQGQTNQSSAGPSSRSKRFVDNFQRQQQRGNNSFRPPKLGIGEDLGGEADPRFESQEEFQYLVGKENVSTRYAMSHGIKEMILSCSFEGRTCEASNFTRFLTNEYGACYSFNQMKLSDEDQVLLRKSYRRGSTYGLQLLMFLEVDEYIPGITLGYGIRLGVSSPTAMPFPVEDGLFVSAGMETDVGVKMINISRQGDPYGVCANPEDFAIEFGFEYTRQGCQSVCPHRMILQYCNCFDATFRRLYPINATETYRPCTTDADFACMADVNWKVTVNESLTCSCPNPCIETAYDTVVSSRDWPENAYMEALLDKVCRTPHKMDRCIELLDQTAGQQRKNFLKVNVFYRELNFETLTEEPDYPESQFLSDLGGSIGLYVGLSVLSIVEVLEFFVEVFVWLFRRCKKSLTKGKTTQRTVEKPGNSSDKDSSPTSHTYSNPRELSHRRPHSPDGNLW